MESGGYIQDESYEHSIKAPSFQSTSIDVDFLFDSTEVIQKKTFSINNNNSENHHDNTKNVFGGQLESLGYFEAKNEEKPVILGTKSKSSPTIWRENRSKKKEHNILNTTGSNWNPLNVPLSQSPPSTTQMNNVFPLQESSNSAQLYEYTATNNFEVRPNFEHNSSPNLSINNNSHERNVLISSGTLWTNRLTTLDAKCEIDFSQLKLLWVLGESAYGVTWRAQLWDMDVAVKRFQTVCIDEISQEFMEDLTLRKSLRHPNCTLFLGFSKLPDFTIITEYMSLGTLRGILDNKKIRVNIRHIITTSLSVARGMNYLHTLNPPLVHGDLSSLTILCHDGWHIKISDYGMARISKILKPDYKGRPAWRAPEYIETNVAIPASDVYSFGVVVWELITQQYPYIELTEEDIYTLTIKGSRLAIPDSCPPILRNLLNDCWNPNPRLRPTFEQILQILLPYEQLVKDDSSWDKMILSNFNNPDQLLSETHSPIDITNLLSLSDSKMISSSYSLILDFNCMKDGVEALKQYSLMNCENCTGALLLTNSFGKTNWLFGHSNHKTISQLEKFVNSNFKQISSFLSTPILRETNRLLTFGLREGAIKALVIQLQIKEGLVDKPLELYQNFAVHDMQKSNPSWCGTIITSEFSGFKVSIITLFDSAVGCKAIISAGYLQEQLKNFRKYMNDVPIIEEYSVDLMTFPTSSPTSPSLLPIVQSKISDLKLQEDTKNIVTKVKQILTTGVVEYSSPTLSPLMYKHIEPHPIPSEPIDLDFDNEKEKQLFNRSIPLSNSTSSLTCSLSPFSPDNILSQSFSLIHQKLTQSNRMNFFKRLTDGGKNRDELVQHYFCNYGDGFNPGHLYITSTSLVFQSLLSIIINDQHNFSIKLKEIYSIDKTKNFPKGSHSITVTTSKEKVYVLKYLFQREQVIATIKNLSEKLQPKHTIILLNNHKPEF